MHRPVIVGIVVVAAALVAAVASCRPEAPPPAPVAPPPAALVPPLNDAAEDEWIRLEAGPDARVFRVVRSNDYEVTVEITHYHDGEPVPAPPGAHNPWTETWSRNGWGLPKDCVLRSIEPDRVEAAGKSYACWRLLVVNRAVREFWWVCDELPVHGVLKIARLGKNGPDEEGALRATDWSGKK